jgi:arylsulfatase A
MNLPDYKTFFIFGLAAIVLSSLSTCIAASGKTEKDKPNIVIIYADDMGYGDLGVQNADSKIPTPNLDRLSQEGVRFTDGHSSSGICTPSRYAILTGRHHWRKFHNIATPFGGSKFDKARMTLPEMLKENGYATACIGKWHLGMDWDSLKKPGAKMKTVPDPSPNRTNTRLAYGPDDFDWSKPVPDGPLAHGFDYYFGDGTVNFPPFCLMENDRLLGTPSVMFKLTEDPPEGRSESRAGPAVPGYDQKKLLPRLTEKAVEWIGKQKGTDKPFFLYFALNAPHTPIVPADEFRGKSKAGPYGDYVYQVDWVTGQVLEALKKNGFDKNTVVVFSSDNGPEVYMKARIKNYDHTSSAPFRGMKRDIWEGGHHIPFLVRWPGVTKPDTTSDALVGQLDLMATFADYLGYEIPQGQAEDSFSMMPVLEGKNDHHRDTLVHNTYKQAYGLRQGDWIYLSDLDTHGKTGKPGLFNLKKDIGQQENLIDKYPEKVKEMKRLLQKIRTSGYDRP